MFLTQSPVVGGEMHGHVEEQSGALMERRKLGGDECYVGGQQCLLHL